MSALTCFVGDLRAVSDLPPIAGLVLHNHPLEYYLQQGSIDPKTGAPAINISVDWSRLAAPAGLASLSSDDPTLFSALGDLLPPPIGKAPPAIGLLLAMAYEAVPQAYGVMFDTNVVDGEPFAPRQGCALFLEGIYHSRAWASDAEFCEFVTYVAIHEVGHAFNLWHANTPSFMGANSNPNDFSAQQFTTDQQAYLATMDGPDSAYVSPGGTPFGVRGPHAPPGIDDGATLLPTLPTDTTFQIALSRDALWAFEPLELEIRFGSPSTTLNMPDVFDPRHDCFRVWITTPRGERRLYKPQARVCGAGGDRSVEAGKPFERDISIFLQSGGYTLNETGPFSFQVELRHGGGVLRSNPATCEVRRADAGDPEFRAVQLALRSRSAASLLRFKRAVPTVPDYDRMLAFAEAFPASPSSAAIHYALGRALLRNATKDQTTSSRSGWLDQRGRHHLARALAHRALAPHARRLAEGLLV